MKILINGHSADITIENEKTLGEILAGMEEWLSVQGHRLSALVIDGKNIEESMIENVITKEIETIKVLEIKTSSVTKLAVVSLSLLLNDLDEFNSLDFNQRPDFFENWKKRPQALFSMEQMSDLFELYKNCFSSSGFTHDALRSMTEERLREVESPVSEINYLRSGLDEICTRLIDLPLDIQTGKDSRANMTIQLFSGIAEKIIRIYKQLENQGFLQVSDSITSLIGKFNDVTRELLQAYEAYDSVLIGDLAEYEISPCLLELYNTITDNINEQEPVKE